MNIIFQRRSIPKKDGTYAIRLKLSTGNKDIQYINTGVSVFKNQWDASKHLVKKHPFEEKINANLNYLSNEIKTLHYGNKGVSAKRLLQIYKNSRKYDSVSFLEFYQEIIDEMELKGKIRSAITNQKYLKKIKEFSNIVLFSDMSPVFAKEYENFMLKKGNKINTIASNFKSIYATLNKAVKLGIIDKNPIKGYKIVTENVEKSSLSFKQIEELSKYDIDNRFKGKIKARDIFVFSFYAAGMRFSDVCKLKWDNIKGDDIVYTMGKSKNRSGGRRSIPLNTKSKEILEKYKGKDHVYIFPPLHGYHNKSDKEIEYRIYISNNTLNRSLKHIDKELKFNINLSMHMAKHSFTDYALKNDISILLISKLLGHTKLSTTEHYLKDFYHKEEAEAIKKMFG